MEQKSTSASRQYIFPPPNEDGTQGNRVGNQNSEKTTEAREDEFLSIPGIEEPPKEGETRHKHTNTSVSSSSSETTVYDSQMQNTFALRKRGNESIFSTETLLDDISQQKSTISQRNRLLPENHLSLSPCKHGCCQKAESAKETTFPFNREQKSPVYGEDAEHKEERERKTPVFMKTPSLPSQAFKSAIMSSNQHDVFKKQGTGNEDLKKMIDHLIEEREGHVRRMSLNEFHDFVEKAENGDNLIIIDVRSFTYFAKAHVKDAINICLPLTLLKRGTYDMTRCINALPDYEKRKLLLHISRHNNNKISNQVVSSPSGNLPCGTYGFPSVILYDNSPDTPRLYHMARKFFQNNFWDDSYVFLLNENFSTVVSTFPQIFDTETGSIGPKNSVDSSIPAITNPVRSMSLTDVPLSNERKSDSPFLSNFKLPALPKQGFKIRHIEELITNKIEKDSDYDILNTMRFYHDLSPNERDQLPAWLIGSLNDTQKIVNAFNKLELEEKERLLSALSTDNPERKTSGFVFDDETGVEFPSSSVPAISSGLEYGHKNRYKDIILFENSRVRLNDLPSLTQKAQKCDYINASYIKPPRKLTELTDVSRISDNIKYIATQGPLPGTIGDFWKCVINNNAAVILSLTDELENGLMKCAPFWKPGIYFSNDNLISVKLVGSQRSESGSVIMRHFEIGMDNIITLNVMQVQLLSWPDMGTALNPGDLLSIIFLKNAILDRIKPTRNCSSVVHCSAGCGRTGTLCTIDTLINVLRNNSSLELPYDPTFCIVDCFRRQRIYMVQTLRQYFLVYNVLLVYFAHTLKLAKYEISHFNVADLTQYDIARHFISTWTSAQ